MKPRLLITTSTLPNGPFDPEPRFVLDLAIALGRHFEVCVLAPRTPSAKSLDSIGGIEFRRYPYAPLRELETLTHPGAILDRLRERPIRWGLVPLLMAGLCREMRRLLVERDFACIHAHWLLPQAVAAQALMRSGKLQVPYIAIAHGADVYAIKGALGKSMLRRAVLHASGIVGVSHALIAALRGKFPIEMNGLPTTVIASGIDPKKFTPALRSDEWPAVHGLSRPLIIFAGRLSEKKGIEILLAAMGTEPLRSVRPSLAIVGRGLLETRLRQLSQKFGLGDRVRFLPACDHSVLGHYLASADVLCLPSVVAASGDQEGRPTVLAEAGACGTPAVVSDIGGLQDWIDDGLSGLLVPPSDPVALARALAGLLTQPERRRRIGEAARQKALEMPWSTVADRYAEFTQQVIERRQ